MSIKPSIFLNKKTGGSAIAKATRSVSGDKSSTGDSKPTVSKLNEARNTFGSSRPSNINLANNQSAKSSTDGQALKILTAGSDIKAVSETTTAGFPGAVGVSGLVEGQSSLVAASTVKNLGGLPGSARPDIFDNDGFGPGQKDFREIWGDNNNNSLGHGSTDGGYGAYGDFIANVVKPKMHDRPADAVVGDKDWKQATTNLGFLFKDGKQLNTALEHTINKIGEDHKDLKNDMWSVSFLAANGISKEAINGEVGDFLLSDKKYFDKFPDDQVGYQGNALEAFTHRENSLRLMELADQEGLDPVDIYNTLKERAGIEGENALFAGSARGFLETAKNFDYLDNLDKKISEAQSESPELANEKAKFNINIHFLPYSGADSGAFPAINRGHEFGQQSKLKDFGLSFDPEKPNQMNFMVNNEAQLEKLLGDIKEKFGNNDSAEIGKLDFSFHRHGGEDGSSLTGNAKVGDKSNGEGGSFVVNDENNFDGKTDGNIYKMLGSIAGENGADININGDSCHSGNHTDLIKDDLVAGVKEGQNATGRDETLKLSIVDNAEAPGYTPAQSLKSHQGYMTYKFDNDGAAGLEFIMSNSSLSKTRRDDLYVNKDTDENNLDAARADKSESGKLAMKGYVDAAEKSIDNMLARKDAGSDNLTKKDSKPSNSSIADSNSNTSDSIAQTNTSSDSLTTDLAQASDNNETTNADSLASNDSTSSENSSQGSLLEQLEKAEAPEQKKPEENTATA